MSVLSILTALARALLATIFVLAGSAKLVGLPWSAEESWNPFGGARVAWAILYRLVSLFELALGVCMLLVPADIAAIATTGFLVPATIYGAMSVRRVGSCGCFGAHGGNQVRRLALRNGSVVLVALALPPIESMPGTGGQAAWVPWIPLLNAALLGVFALLRLLGDRQLDRHPRAMRLRARPHVGARA
ncbi:MAG TPA: MauE/DoxX family redox-associated membrane protein [Actinomycetota bacterium]|nr:MauE/DoxX family redox-associated membrane protein [Actinomycetota bacterium]